jgi:hypothetical protein
MITHKDLRFFNDAESFLKGKEDILGLFRVNPRDNNLYVSHQFNYENKFLNTIKTVPSTVGSQTIYRFGDSITSGINDQTHYNKCISKVLNL